MRFEFGSESGVLYVRVREGDIEETPDLAELEFGAHLDIDREGNVMGVEFLSLQELFTELVPMSAAPWSFPSASRT
jgi:uncharacterized protein YuzE